MNFNTTHEKNTFFIHVFLVFLFYIVGDLISTYLAIQQGGVEVGLFSKLLPDNTHLFLYTVIIKLFFLAFVICVGKYLVTHKYYFAWNFLVTFLILFGMLIIVCNACLLITDQNLLQYLIPL